MFTQVFSLTLHATNHQIMDAKQLYTLYTQSAGITTDSRQCPEGSIFVALRGDSFDGNRFAAQALEKGCAWAVVDDPTCVPEGDSRYILVPSALVAYKEIAREHRRQFSIPVIGITGTNGKTTTKELVAAVLERRFRVMRTEANFNNDVGVPRTLLRLSPSDEIAVVEMGASHPGDIRQLVDYVEPTCGLITNVGCAHLEGFGSFEGVKRTKGELYDHLAAHHALLFLNEGSADLVEMAAERLFERVVGYAQGEPSQCSVTGRVVACDPCLRMVWTADTLPQGQEMEVRTQLIGAYNADNVLAAVAIGLHFGVEPQQIVAALEEYAPSNNRSQLMKTERNTLIVDAYNANPTSMAAAIDNFEMLSTPQPKMAIVGEMRELGAASEKEHQRVADLLVRSGLTNVWLVGAGFANVGTPFRRFADAHEVREALLNEKPEGFCILIKGSNGTHLYDLPEVL